MLIVKEFCFDAAHRLRNYIGKCATLHGHRYTFKVGVNVHSIDSRGIGVDFSDLKSTIGKFIDDRLDHTAILCREDPLTGFLSAEYQDSPVISGEDTRLLRRPYIMEGNPTAENMAIEFFGIFSKLLSESFPDSALAFLEVYETPTSFVRYPFE